MPPAFDRSTLGLRRLHVKVLCRSHFRELRGGPAAVRRRSRPTWPSRCGPTGSSAPGSPIAGTTRSPPTGSSRSRTTASAITAGRRTPSIPWVTVARFRSTGFAAQLDAVMQRAPEVGLTQHVVRRSWLDSGALGHRSRVRSLSAAARSPDRQPRRASRGTAARLDHRLRRCDTDLHLGPTTFGLAYCDHVVLYRFTPRAPRLTDCEVTWLVNGSAVEGQRLRPRDADLALGCHDDRGQADHRAQPGGRRLALLRAGSAVVDGRFHAAFPALVRRARCATRPLLRKTAPRITQE